MTGEQQERFCAALADAFDKSELAHLVRFRLDKALASLVDTEKPGEAVVFDLVESVKRRGLLRELVRAACEARPQNVTLQSFLNEEEKLAVKLGHVESQLDDLKKMQEQMALQLNRDLLTMRYKAYGRLWARTEPTKLYATEEFGPKVIAALSDALTGWYFSSTGGLLLTDALKGFYFALQDLVLAVGQFHGTWICRERPADPKEVFGRLLDGLSTMDPEMRDQIRLARTEPTALDPVKWRTLCGLVAENLRTRVTLDGLGGGGVMVFAAVQQVASILRSNLAHELGSRIQVERPTTG